MYTVQRSGLTFTPVTVCRGVKTLPEWWWWLSKVQRELHKKDLPRSCFRPPMLQGRPVTE